MLRAAIQRFTTVPTPYLLADAEAFVELAHRWWAEGSEATWAIRLDERLVGMVGLTKLPSGAPEIGYWVSSSVRGRGVAREAVRAVIDWAFSPARPALARVEWRAAVGNLGSALANYKGFAERGFFIAGLYDADRQKIGKRVDGLRIRHIDQLEEDAARLGVAIGIIATPGVAAQDVAERLERAGVRSILNFAPATIRVAPPVVVRSVDLSTELQILSYYLSRE